MKPLSILLLTAIFIAASTLGVEDTASHLERSTFAEENTRVTRFIVTGDTRGSVNGINVAILTEMVDAILNEDVDFVLVPGDLVNGSSDPAVLKSQLLAWRNVMQPLYDAGIGVYPCRGNHDAYDKSVWDEIFSGLYTLPANGPAGEENVTYAFTYNNILFVALDQYIQSHRINQVWLNQQLAAHPYPHLFVFGHEPAFKVRHTSYLGLYPVQRNNFWNSLSAHGGKTYFCGHDHFYDHARLDDGDGDTTNDLHQLIVGTAGAPLAGDGAYDGNNGTWTPLRVHHEANYGYLLVEVSGLEVTMTWKHRVAPNTFVDGGDTWSYTAEYTPCCVDIRGNVDGDPAEKVDTSDLNFMAAYLFLSGSIPPCPEEADVNGDGSINVSDIASLVGFLYHGDEPPVACDKKK